MFLDIRALLLADNAEHLPCGVVPNDVADGGLNDGNTKTQKINMGSYLVDHPREISPWVHVLRCSPCRLPKLHDKFPMMKRPSLGRLPI